ICRAARAQGTAVVLMTFAIHLPPDYTQEAFLARRLSYAVPPRDVVELWGRPEHVAAAVAAHNRAGRSVGERCGGQGSEQGRLWRGGRRSFADVCHFPAAGKERFVDNLVGDLDTDHLPQP